VDDWIGILLPAALILARVSGFLLAAPLFSSTTIPLRIRLGFCLLLTLFIACARPPSVDAAHVDWLVAVVMIGSEVAIGLALGLAARLVFTCVQQGGQVVGRQMGISMANEMDPTSDERSQPIGSLFSTAFLLLFLAIGGHHLLISAVARSYDALPAGRPVDTAAMAECVVQAGEAMLLLGLKLAAPVLAAFVVLAVMLAVLARVLPEMNLLMASLPLRVALGMIMAAAVLPLLESFTEDVAGWIQTHLVA
jgi:flagellar biosynthetic protein FliR